MREILGSCQAVRMARLPTETTTVRAISIEMLWLCVAAESQSSPGLLQRRSSVELSHRRVVSPGAGTTTVTEEGLSARVLIGFQSVLNIGAILRCATSVRSMCRIPRTWNAWIGYTPDPCVNIPP